MKKTILKTLLYVFVGLIVVVATAPLYSENNMLRSISSSIKNGNARIDIYNTGTQDNQVEIIEVSNEAIKSSYPQWCKTKTGQCSVVTVNSFDEPINFKIKAKKAGTVKIILMGPDVTHNNKRYPVIVDYADLVVNGENVFSETTSVFHDNPYRYTMAVKDGDTIEVSVNADNHFFGFSDLKYFNVNYVKLSSIVVTYIIIIGIIALYRKKKAKKAK